TSSVPSSIYSPSLHDALPIFNGQQGLMVNAPGMFHSLVGELLSRKSGSFALMWSAGKGGLVKVGLRSQRGFDCIPLAESMGGGRSEEHTSELQSRENLVCRLL